MEDIRDLGFPIKRIYFTFGVPEGGLRGNHAHKQLQQVLWSPRGRIQVTVDDGTSSRSYSLDVPDKALIIPGRLWLKLQWEEADSILCVAVSDYYDEEDYIRDYGAFLTYIKGGI